MVVETTERVPIGSLTEQPVPQQRTYQSMGFPTCCFPHRCFHGSKTRECTKCRTRAIKRTRHNKERGRENDPSHSLGSFVFVVAMEDAWRTEPRPRPRKTVGCNPIFQALSRCIVISFHKTIWHGRKNAEDYCGLSVVNGVHRGHCQWCGVTR